MTVCPVGDLEVLEKVYIAGVDHGDEIAQLRRALEAARAEYDKGGYTYPGGDDDYEARAGRLRDRLTRLAAEPTKGPGYEYKPIG
jgi:hypothetical protein